MPVQSSGSIYVPSTNETQETTSIFPNTLSTWNESTPRITEGETQKDVFDFDEHDSDDRQQREGPARLVR